MSDETEAAMDGDELEELRERVKYLEKLRDTMFRVYGEGDVTVAEVAEENVGLKQQLLEAELIIRQLDEAVDSMY